MVGIGQLTVLTRIYLGLEWMSLHWDYRCSVLLQTVLALMCNRDPGWQVSFIGPADLADAASSRVGRWRVPAQHTSAEVSPVISARCRALVAATGLLPPYGLWGWVLWVASWHLQNGPSLTCLGAELLFALVLERKGWDVTCLSSRSRWRQPVLRSWLPVRVVLRQDGDVIY